MPKAKIRALKTVWQLRFYDAERRPKETTNSIPQSQYSRDEAEAEWWRRWTLYKSSDHAFDPWQHATPEEAGSRGSDTTLTVKQALDRYVDDKKKAGRRDEARGWSDETIKRYEPTFNKMARDLGSTSLFRHLTTEDLARFIHRDGLANATKRTYRKMIGAWLTWMKRRGYNVPDIPPPLRERRKIPAYVTRDELAKICKRHLKTARDKAQRNDNPDAPTREWMVDAWQFAFWQGLRRSEIVAQRVGGVDLGRGVMRVGDKTFVPKGQDEAVIPLATPAIPIAVKWCKDAAPDMRLFRRSTAKYIADAFTAAARKEVPEKPDLTLHSLRHGRCVDLLEKGKPLQEVQRFLRHKSIKSTMYYVQVVNKHLTESIQSMNEDDVDIENAEIKEDDDE